MVRLGENIKGRKRGDVLEVVGRVVLGTGLGGEFSLICFQLFSFRATLQELSVGGRLQEIINQEAPLLPEFFRKTCLSMSMRPAHLQLPWLTV